MLAAALDVSLLIIVVLCFTQLLCGSAAKPTGEGDSGSLSS
jgi:hypothetical protein